jgi:HK97 family phage major capsid protein
MKSLKNVTINLIVSLLLIAFSALLITSFTGLSYAYSFGLLFIVACFIKQPQGALFETLVKPLAEQLEEMKASLQSVLTKEAKTEVDKQLKEFETKNKEAIEGYPELKSTLDQLKKDAELNQPVIDAFVKNGKTRTASLEKEVKSFNEILAERITENAERIQNMAPGTTSKANPLIIDLAPDVKQDGAKQREVKAVGDMSISANFTAASSLYADVRTNLIETPYNKVYLSDILPSGTSNGTNVVYPKENGGEGAAAAWTDYTADKAQIDYDLTSQTAYFKWIAGYAIIQRDMLDDIPFMLSYLQSRLLISLKTAENDVILNGTSDSNPIQGLADNATAYSGTFANPVDRIIDAGWGQIVEDTNEFYSPTHVIMRPRDAVKVGLNKAGGSQEYDLPAGSVAFVNGKLTVGGLTVVGTTQMGANTFYAIDNRALLFIRRIQPELRIFEDSTLAKKNKIMFRIEEKVTLVTFNNSAIVTGTLDTTV